MTRKKRKNFIIIFVLAIVTMLTVVVLFMPFSGKNLISTFSSGERKNPITIIIDAGHGGIDGGAVGVDNIVEKNINLSIALKLRDMLLINGFNVIMTRETDMSIHDDIAKTAKEIKTSDLHNRMKIMQDNPEALFISIHQNKFEKASSKGTQVFYGTNNFESEYLAMALQNTVREAIQNENKREIKPATSSLYLLDKTQNVAVMVECGFLSNKDEAYLLISDDYQNKMAFSIYAGIIRYFVQE
jgi:N-acetylmuramoyl-L-alanine amidase